LSITQAPQFPSSQLPVASSQHSPWSQQTPLQQNRSRLTPQRDPGAIGDQASALRDESQTWQSTSGLALPSP
jgi:hypothetical protein